MNEIEIKKKELAIFKSAISFDLKEGEQLLTVIFVSGDQKLHYSFICKNTEKFNNVENNRLYEIYPQYQEVENFFYIHGNKIIKSKTL